MAADPGTGATAGAGARRSSMRSGSWWTLAVPALAFLVGLLVGGVVVDVPGDDDASKGQQEAASLPSARAATETPADSPTTVVVPAAPCLAAADTVERVTALTEQGAGAMRDFKPQKLRELLTELERLDGQARRQAEACRRGTVETSAPP